MKLQESELADTPDPSNISFCASRPEFGVFHASYDRKFVFSILVRETISLPAGKSICENGVSI